MGPVTVGTLALCVAVRATDDVRRERPLSLLGGGSVERPGGKDQGRLEDGLGSDRRRGANGIPGDGGASTRGWLVLPVGGESSLKPWSQPRVTSAVTSA